MSQRGIWSRMCMREGISGGVVERCDRSTRSGACADLPCLWSPGLWLCRYSGEMFLLSCFDIIQSRGATCSRSARWNSQSRNVCSCIVTLIIILGYPRRWEPHCCKDWHTSTLTCVLPLNSGRVSMLHSNLTIFCCHFYSSGDFGLFLIIEEHECIFYCAKFYQRR